MKLCVTLFQLFACDIWKNVSKHLQLAELIVANEAAKKAKGILATEYQCRECNI